MMIAMSVLTAPVAQAEFRVFRLRITNQADGTERTVVSRLDDIQYAGYNLLKRSEFVVIEQTWMCYARNDYAGTLCPAPDDRPALQVPASAP